MPTFANTIDGNEILAKRSQCDYAGADIQTTYATKSEVTTGLSGKQDTISDLATIRSGAQDGASAVQPGDLATVATTGDYSDLSNKPTIPAAQINSDWNASSGVTEILNKPDLSVYATTSDVTTGLAAKQDVISDLATIRSGAQAGASAVQPGNLATVATTGDYSDLSNKPTIPSGTQLVPASTSADANKVLTVDAQGTPGWATSAPGGVTDVEVDGTSVVSQGVASITMPTVDQTYNSASINAQSGVAMAGALASKQDTISDLSTIRSGAQAGSTAVQPGDLATVATTGSYADLSGTPSVEDVFYATYGTTTWAQVQAAYAANNNTRFVLVSPLTGQIIDAFFELNDPTSNLGSLRFTYYRSTVNNSQISETINWLSGIDDSWHNDHYSNNSAVQSNWNESDTHSLAYIQNKPTLATVATSGSYNDLSNTPTIPDSTSDLTNDSGFITLADVPAQVQSDWSESDTTDPAYIQNKPTLATVATTGSYTDLTSKPTEMPIVAGNGISITVVNNQIVISATGA